MKASKSRRTRVFKRLSRREVGLLLPAVLYLLAYQLVIIQFPEFIRNEVITPIATTLLTVEGLLLALSPQMRPKLVRDFVAVGLGVPAILLSVVTLAVSVLQSVQFQYLSSSTTTTLFRLDSALFGLLVELYAIGILFQTFEKDPAETEP